MRAFLLGFLGALVALVSAMFLFAQYSDYRAAAETAGWLADIRRSPLPELIERIAKQGGVEGSGVGIAAPQWTGVPPTLFEITDDGIVLMRGGRDGQLLVMIPEWRDGAATYRCLGGSAKATPRGCRAGDPATR
jgi:hypothetical protein